MCRGVFHSSHCRHFRNRDQSDVKIHLKNNFNFKHIENFHRYFVLFETTTFFIYLVTLIAYRERRTIILFTFACILITVSKAINRTISLFFLHSDSFLRSESWFHDNHRWLLDSSVARNSRDSTEVRRDCHDDKIRPSSCCEAV